MKKTAVFRGLLLSSVALAVAACGNLSKVTDEGTTENPVFPKIAESEFNHDGSQFGSWPNWEYAFNYREQGVHKICQYKILFDKNMNAQSFFWYPNGCNGNSSFNLSGDFLFDFDKDTLTAKGREVVDNVAQQLKSSGAAKVKIEGYTDRLGSVAYNLDLSNRRANRVKNRLIEQGVNAEFEAIGHGKANQVKACAGMKGQAEKDCLRPNRRVIISASGNVLTQQEGANVAGPNGPAPLYQTPAYNNGNK